MAKIEVNTIDTRSASTTLKLGDTNATTLDFDTGITEATNIPYGLNNSPAFLATRSTNQSISANTNTKVQCDSESLGFDTDNAYDNSTNYRFTVPTGKGGKYLFQTGVTMNNYFAYVESSIQVNGSEAFRGSSVGNDASSTMNSTFIIDLDAADYVEFFVQQNKTGQNIEGSSSLRRTYFAGMRLIGI